MEHYEEAHRRDPADPPKLVSDKKTPRTILKNVSHSKSSSQSTMSHNHTRPQTAAGFVTPEKSHPVAVRELIEIKDLEQDASEAAR